MRGKRTAVLLAALLAAGSGFGQNQYVSVELSLLSEASGPRMVDNRLLLTYSFGTRTGDGRIHTVEAAFEHEGFRVRHPFARNHNGVYLLLVDVPIDASELRYRLVVDGIWTADPGNPDVVVGRWGVRLSRFVPVRDQRTVSESPIRHRDGTIEFYLNAPAGSRVTVVGSFNGWDPWNTPLEEIRPGTFSVRMRLGPGEHLYYFLVDGLRLPDPLNRERAWSTHGMVASVVQAPPRQR